MTKIYTVIDTSGDAISSGGGTKSGNVDMENPGRGARYSIAVKGDIASLDIDLDIEIPRDSEVYDTTLTGGGVLGGLDTTDGGEVRNERDVSGLGVLRAADVAHITVTNNDASAGDATVKILQHEYAL